MDREELYLAIGQAEDKYIEEAAKDIRSRRRRLRPWLGGGAVLAACLGLALISPLRAQLMGMFQRDSAVVAMSGQSEEKTENTAAPDDQPSTAADSVDGQEDAVAENEGSTAEKALYIPEGTIIDHSPEMNYIACYAAVKDGTWFYSAAVGEALADHKGENCTYFLQIEIFQGEDMLDADSEPAQAELIRLREEGFRVGLTWAESDEGEMVCGAGYFTAEELERLTVGENVGFMLSFLDESGLTGQGIVLAEQDALSTETIID